jgi:hypothetical protein
VGQQGSEDARLEKHETLTNTNTLQLKNRALLVNKWLCSVLTCPLFYCTEPIVDRMAYDMIYLLLRVTTLAAFQSIQKIFFFCFGRVPERVGQFNNLGRQHGGF